MTDPMLLNYGNLIAQRIEKRDGTPIPNGTLAHASLLVEAMFRHASSAVRILTGELNARVYGTPEVISRAQEFLANSEHTLEIIFEGDFDDAELKRHPLLASVNPSNVKLFRLNADLKSKVRAHFAIMDTDSYRFEADKLKPSAVAAFGDKSFARDLLNVFEGFKSHGSKQITNWGRA